MTAPEQQAGSYTQVSHDSIFKKAMGRLDALFVGFGATVSYTHLTLPTN